MGIFDVFGEIIKQVANKNETDEKVKTADPVVFEEVKKKLENVEANVPSGGRRAGSYRDYEEKVLEVQRENEANPNVETADKSVFDDLLAEIKKLQEQEQNQSTNASPRPHIEQPTYIPPVQRGPLESNTSHREPAQMPEPKMTYGSQAMTNSPGSLALRDAPDMGAGKIDIRVPNKSLLNILQYSENAIMLDGKRSRFVLVEYQGQQGWILENYLNFN